MITEGLNIRCKSSKGIATGTIVKRMNDLLGVVWDGGISHRKEALYFWNNPNNLEING